MPILELGQPEKQAMALKVRDWEKAWRVCRSWEKFRSLKTNIRQYKRNIEKTQKPPRKSVRYEGQGTKREKRRKYSRSQAPAWERSFCGSAPLKLRKFLSPMAR
jgi:hypothetical protein